MKIIVGILILTWIGVTVCHPVGTMVGDRASRQQAHENEGRDEEPHHHPHEAENNNDESNEHPHETESRNEEPHQNPHRAEDKHDEPQQRPHEAENKNEESREHPHETESRNDEPDQHSHEAEHRNEEPHQHPHDTESRVQEPYQQPHDEADSSGHGPHQQPHETETMFSGNKGQGEQEQPDHHQGQPEPGFGQGHDGSHEENEKCPPSNKSVPFFIGQFLSNVTTLHAMGAPTSVVYESVLIDIQSLGDGLYYWMRELVSDNNAPLHFKQSEIYFKPNVQNTSTMSDGTTVQYKISPDEPNIFVKWFYPQTGESVNTSFIFGQCNEDFVKVDKLGTSATELRHYIRVHAN